MGVALFVSVPATDQGTGVGEAFGRALSHGPAALTAHTGIGLLLIINVIVVLVLAIRSRLRTLMISAVVGLLCVVGAAFSGANFVNTGANGTSMAMAVLTEVFSATFRGSSCARSA